MNEMNARQVLLAEAAAYFHSHVGLERLCQGLIDKYRTLGRFSGSVVLPNVSQQERAVLEAFFRKRLPGLDLRLTVRDFQAALAETRFGELDVLAMLAAWQQAPLTSRQEDREHATDRWKKTWHHFLREHPQPFCQLWLQAVLNKEVGTRCVQSWYRRDKRFEEQMALALRALANLPIEYQRIPVFSREICGSPHALDLNTTAGKLFLEGLRFIRAAQNGTGQQETEEQEELSATEEVSELFYYFRLLRDDLLNFVTCIGLVAYDLSGEIAYWRRAAEVGAPLNIPLREVVRSVRLEAVAGQGEYEVLVVENSGVLSALLDVHMLGAPWKSKPLVCLHGQLKLASWALLDRLIQSGARLRYAGDFDPEGLQIAQKILLRYPGRASLWRMTAADYWAAGPAAPLDASRINKLRSITAPELLPSAELIQQTGLAAYQEGLLTQLASDLFADLHGDGS